MTGQHSWFFINDIKSFCSKRPFKVMTDDSVDKNIFLVFTRHKFLSGRAHISQLILYWSIKMEKLKIQSSQLGQNLMSQRLFGSNQLLLVSFDYMNHFRVTKITVLESF
jgi:hypothetical protein